jgi:hypothetical protein
MQNQKKQQPACCLDIGRVEEGSRLSGFFNEFSKWISWAKPQFLSFCEQEIRPISDFFLTPFHLLKYPTIQFNMSI